jgi:hypothetical protein
MSQNTIDCPSSELHDSDSGFESTRLRYDLVVRARQAILSGRYDNDAAIEQMLVDCVDDIVEDVRGT